MKGILPDQFSAALNDHDVIDRRVRLFESDNSS